jgi:hypothetical protein
MLNIYMDSIKPPMYYPNFEFNLILNIKDDEEYSLRITIFKNKEEAEKSSALSQKLYQLTNFVNGENSYGKKFITFQVVNNEIVLKTLSPGLSG